MGEIPALVVEVTRLPEGKTVVSVSGDLDLGIADKLRAALRDALTFPLTVLDLTACTFCDSVGLRAILEAARTARGAGTMFRVAGVGRAIAWVIDLAGVGSVLDLFPDREAALNI